MTTARSRSPSAYQRVGDVRQPLTGSPGGRRKPPHYLTAPCLQSWHFVKRESPRDSSIYLITNPPGLILGPVHLRSIAELSPSSVAGRIHLHSGGTGVMDVLTAVTTARRRLNEMT